MPASYLQHHKRKLNHLTMKTSNALARHYLPHTGVAVQIWGPIHSSPCYAIDILCQGSARVCGDRGSWEGRFCAVRMQVGRGRGGGVLLVAHACSL